MALSTEVAARKYLDVSADTAIDVDIPAFENSDIFVYYGSASLTAVQGADYSVTLADDFNTFTVTPTASLLTKIEALIAADPAETNFITVRRTLDYETEATPDGVRYTPFTSREFDRNAMRDQQLSDRLNRTLTFPEGQLAEEVDGSVVNVAPGQVIRRDDDGLGFSGANLEIAVNEVDAWFQNRDVTAATQGALLTNGSVFYMEGLPYKTNSSIAMADSATRDLGVAGVEPAGQEIYLQHYGVKFDKITDGFEGFASAVAFAEQSNRRLVVRGGPVRTSDTITFAANDLQVEFVGDARIVPDTDVLIGLIMGEPSSSSRMRIVRPTVDRETYDGSTENIGILYREMNQCTITDAESRHSKYNHDFYPTVTGCAYNTFLNMQGVAGYKNFRTRAVGTGWVNENVFLGGRGFCTSNTHTNFSMENGDDLPVTGVTQANPAVVTCPSHGFSTGDTVTLNAVEGMTQINEVPRTITVIDANRFSMVGGNGVPPIDSTAFGAYTSGGTAVSGKGTGHNRMIGMSLEGQGVQGVWDNGSSNKWDQCRSEGTWSGGAFHVYGPYCRYAAVEGSRLDYLIDKTAAVDPRDTVFAYRTGSKLATAVNGLTTLELENQSQSGGSGLDIKSRLDNLTSFAWRVIRRGDGLVRASLTTNGFLTLGIGLYVEQHGWNFKPFRMGVLRKWASGNGTTGYLTRHKYQSDPTSETDGLIVMEAQESVDLGFNNAANIVNAKSKYRGKIVYDTTTNQPLWASGDSATATWKTFTDNSVVYTPS